MPNAGLPGRTLIYGGTGCSEADYPASRPESNWIAVVDGGTTACSYLLRTEIAQSLNADARRGRPQRRRRQRRRS